MKKQSTLESEPSKNISLPVIDTPAWIWAPGKGEHRIFRRDFISDGTPVVCRVSADMSYLLKLDGRRVGRGPDRSLLSAWDFREYRFEVSPGRHRIEAVVRHGGIPPLAQITYRPGFILVADEPYGAELSTGQAEWIAMDLDNVSQDGDNAGAFGLGKPDVVKGFSPDFAVVPDELFGPVEIVRILAKPNKFCHVLPGWQLKPSGLPPQSEHQFTPDGWTGPVSVPANTSRTIDIGLDNYYCAYPELEVQGGKGSEIRLGWSENISKADKSFTDVFLPAGGRARFTTTWFRAGRHLRITVKTSDEPLLISELTLAESRYPLQEEGVFECDDTSLDDVQRICRRALAMCAHDTVTDCAFYEQLQYLGDGAVQFAAHSALSRDDRLLKRMIETFEGVTRQNGLMPMNAPVEGPASESTAYTIWYPVLLGEFFDRFNDKTWLKSRLPSLAHVIAGLHSLENETGLIIDAPGWNFIDWIGDFENSSPLILNLTYVYALQNAARIENAIGSSRFAEEYEARANAAILSIRKFFADDKDWRSEHARAFAVLTGYDVNADLDAPDLIKATVYFSHWIFEALAKQGKGSEILSRLDLWRGYVNAGLKTTPEQPLPSRSDCHGWGAHPIYHLLSSVAGVRPSAPFFEKVIVSPQPGNLKYIRAKVPHPKGIIIVDLNFTETVHGTIELPDGIEGMFVFGEIKEIIRSGINIISGNVGVNC